MELTWLSYTMSVNAPRPPAIPAPSVTEFMSIAETGANVQFLQCYNHTGTHLDTAAHVFEDGVALDQFLPSDLVYERVLYIDMSGTPDDTVIMPKHLEPFLAGGADHEALVIRFGVEEWRENEKNRFSNHCPGFGPEAAKYIHSKMPGLRMIGTDVPSIACINSLDETMCAHNEFFVYARTEKFIIVEEMKLLSNIKGIKHMTVSPWMVEWMNSGPCVIWALTA
ncbi:MAG: cyclase family protein [Clostridiales bacterium]|nr:cyclase family protein [Clostridiales bacterium]